LTNFVEKCGCQLYKHYKFPRDEEARLIWAKLVNRKLSETDNSLWMPTVHSVMCSIHFIDSKPTNSNPWPTLHLGYDASEKLKTLELKRNRMRSVSATVSATTSSSTHCNTPLELANNIDGADDKASKYQPHSPIYSSTSFQADQTRLPDSQPQGYSYSDIEVKYKIPIDQASNTTDIDPSTKECECEDLKKHLQIARGMLLKSELRLKEKSHLLKCFTKPVSQRLLKTDSDVVFYTGIPQLCTFNLVCKYMKDCTRSTSKKPTAALNVKLKYKKIKKMPERKLNLIMEDRILLTLMKLRLGLLHKDLADR